MVDGTKVGRTVGAVVVRTLVTKSVAKLDGSVVEDDSITWLEGNVKVVVSLNEAIGVVEVVEVVARFFICHARPL